MMNRFSPFIFCTILVSLVVVSGFGLASTMQLPSPLMSVAHEDKADHGHSCPMSPLEHVSWWSGFSSCVTQTGSSLALYSALIIFGLFFARTLPRHVCVDMRAAALKRQRFRRDLPSPLASLFSDGILQRRIYA